MTSFDGSYPGPFRSLSSPEQSVGHIHLIGEEWVEHGYKTTPIFDEVEPCAICDAPDQTCTHFNTVPFEGSNIDMSPRFTPSDLPEPADSYQPGSFAESDPYDVPGGSQASQPEKRDSLPTTPDDFELVVDPDDADYGLLTGVKPTAGNTGTAPVPSYEVDEDGDFIVVPQE